MTLLQHQVCYKKMALTPQKDVKMYVNQLK